jgi:hypothetical protein
VSFGAGARPVSDWDCSASCRSRQLLNRCQKLYRGFESPLSARYLKVKYLRARLVPLTRASEMKPDSFGVLKVSRTAKTIVSTQGSTSVILPSAEYLVGQIREDWW